MHRLPAIPIQPMPAAGRSHDPGPDDRQRRRVLQLMAASMALATGACTRAPEQHIYPYVRMPEAGTDGLATYYASAFVRDGFAHGVLVGTREGRPVKIEGNPLHPASLGATDAFAQASVLELWDPDRSRGVRLRGPAGASASSWVAFEAAWRERAAKLQAGRGAGLHIVTGNSTSPTLAAQLAQLQAAFPGLRRYRHAPLQWAAADDGARLAFGRMLRTVPHPDRARLILALGCDPFSDGSGAVAFAAGWARQRASALGASRPPCRLLALETSPGLFGARADLRVALSPAQTEAMLWRVAGALFPQGAIPCADTSQAPHSAMEARLVQELRAAGPAALILAGEQLSPASHALVHALHQRLGAFGHTLDAIEAPDAVTSGTGTLADLAGELHAGHVDTLLLLDTNPAYDAPGSLDMERAIGKAAFSAHLGLHDDETGQACQWHLPLSHGYEAWSDARAFDGTASLLQPAIAPLYDSRSPHELLALLAGDSVRDGHALLQRQWAFAFGTGPAFDAGWRTSLRDGVVAGSAFAPVPLPAARWPAPLGASVPDALVAVFPADTSMACGRFANNGWLQELPRPFTKLTWDNAATLGPRTAVTLGVQTGDIVRIQLAHADGAATAALEAPVWVESLHAEGVVSLPLGYGRRHAGRVGDGVGFDAYRLRPVQAGPLSVTLQRTAGHHAFAVTQHHMEQEGRALARSVPLAAPRLEPAPPRDSLYPARAPGEHAWAMNIDLDACIGCNACMVACQSENNIPVVGAEQVARGRDMHWIRIDHYQDPAAGSSIFQPVPCMHCEDAPCEVVCPVGATMHDSDGLNVQVYNRCVGTRFCSNNCPYKVRRFNFLQYADETTETAKAMRNPEVTVRQRGVMEKCSYCLQRVNKARQQAEKEGRPLADGDVRTACQSACPTQAIRFGDLQLAGSAVAAARQSPRHYALLEELNTRPRTTYLAKVVDREPPA